MIALIAACDRNGVIGYKGRIPWNIKGEQKRFKELTTGNIVVMGRLSFEEIGHPLPGRTTLVLSNTFTYSDYNLLTVTSLSEAIAYGEDRDIYISGGARLYQEGLPIADKIYLTIIESEFTGDTFFPEINLDEWIKSYELRVEGEIPYTYITLERIQ
ncbi:MAG: dihydrofolate reductase [Anaerocolumna sp.]|jgi:dihydrofolate reductase|nr:dihydrofolate reductase [Anaerocolumna sp.]